MAESEPAPGTGEGEAGRVDVGLRVAGGLGEAKSKGLS